MVSVRFRPHKLSILVITGGYYDANHDYVEGSEYWTDPIPCRYEPNGRARTVPVGESREHVRLYDAEGDLLDEFEARGFHRGQLDAKLWV